MRSNLQRSRSRCPQRVPSPRGGGRWGRGYRWVQSSLRHQSLHAGLPGVDGSAADAALQRHHSAHLASRRRRPGVNEGLPGVRAQRPLDQSSPPPIRDTGGCLPAVIAAQTSRWRAVRGGIASLAWFQAPWTTTQQWSAWRAEHGARRRVRACGDHSGDKTQVQRAHQMPPPRARPAGPAGGRTHIAAAPVRPGWPARRARSPRQPGRGSLAHTIANVS